MTKFARGVIYLQHFIGNNKMLAGMKFVRQNLFGKKFCFGEWIIVELYKNSGEGCGTLSP